MPVEEYLVFDNAVYPASSSSSFYRTATQLNARTQTQSRTQVPSLQVRPQACRIIEQSQENEFKNPLINAVVSLANETARAGYGKSASRSKISQCVLSLEQQPKLSNAPEIFRSALETL